MSLDTRAEMDTVALVADLLRADVHNYLTASYHLQEIADRDAREVRRYAGGYAWLFPVVSGDAQ